MGVSGNGHQGAPLTPLGDALAKQNRPTVGPRLVPIAESNDPVANFGDPAGFPRNVLFEHRVMQIVQMPNQVLMLHMFEKRWRVIWTDGRAFPKDPDPRYYGYSVGRWENDTTLVVDTVGMDERTWLDNAGWPHSADMRVEERYHRVDNNTLDITVTINDPTVYTKPWGGLWQTAPGAPPSDKLRFTSLPPDTDMLEYIQSASEAAEYRETIADPTKR